MHLALLTSVLVSGMLAAAVNTLCPISGRPVKADCTAQIDGATVAFCCGGCRGQFEDLPAKTRADRLASVTKGEDGADSDAQSAKEAPAKASVTPLATVYMLERCPISGKSINSMNAAASKTIGDREIRVCCPGCFDRYEGNRERYDARVDSWIIKEQKAGYPLDVCLASGRPIDVKGTPTDAVHGNRLMRFCCGGCASYVIDDPQRVAKAHRQLDEAYVARDAPQLTETTCIVSGEDLGDKPVTLVVGNTLVQTCCRHCAGKFMKSPRTFLDKAGRADTADDADG